MKPGCVEAWEDGRRDGSTPGVVEWWYFDAILDNGAKVVLVFSPKATTSAAADHDTPSVRINMNTSDGRAYAKEFVYEPDEASFAASACDVAIGPHRFAGDLKTYDVHAEPIEGWGCDLKLTSTFTPWRPGAGYIKFDEGQPHEQYVTWLFAVPAGTVEGSVTVDGKTEQVTGTAYHDHQWGSNDRSTTFNHWIWARQNTGTHNILVFDMVASESYRYKRMPLVFVEDAAGEIVYQSIDNIRFEVLEDVVDDASGKHYPKRCRYTFEGDGAKVRYELEATEVIQNQDIYSVMPEQVQQRYDVLRLRPSYLRFHGYGKLAVEHDGEVQESGGELIYEMLYSGLEYRVD